MPVCLWPVLSDSYKMIEHKLKLLDCYIGDLLREWQLVDMKTIS